MGAWLMNLGFAATGVPDSPAVGPPFDVQKAEMFTAGRTAGELFTAGRTAGEIDT